jgi:nitric oxide dioxygenase
MGEFTLDRKKTTPVVLMSGGVGITPMKSMLATLLAGRSERKVTFVHACRNTKVHAFRDFLRHAVSEYPNVKRAVFYEEVGAADRKGVDYDFEGRMDIGLIEADVMLPDADYYLCGPVAFMREQREALIARGVDASRIHTEIFGSGML